MCHTVAVLRTLLAAVALVSPVTVMTVDWVDGFAHIYRSTPPPSPQSLTSFHHHQQQQHHHHHLNRRSSSFLLYDSSSSFLAATNNDDGENTSLDQAPGESDAAYIQRLQAHSAALMAESKIRITMDDMHQKTADEEQQKHDALETYKEYELMNNKPSKNGDSEEDAQDTEHSTPPKQKTGGYQRVEDWDAEQKRKKANGELSWEERVQFDGLREGNQVKQNDILRKNLNMF